MGKIGAAAMASVIILSLIPLSIAVDSKEESDPEAYQWIGIVDDAVTKTASAYGGKIGILLVGFGEPEKYDADAYEGWKNFLLNYMSSGMRMMGMSFMYPMVKEMMIPMIDGGTLLVDKDEPFATEPKEQPNLVDAWGRGYEDEEYTWVSVTEGEFPMLGPLFSYYQAPSGPGKGESDFWEYVGLTMYGFYQQMGGYNPGGERELRIMDEVEAELRQGYGDKIIIGRGFGAARPGFPDFRETAEEMIEMGVTKLIVAEAYVCFSEFEHPITEIAQHLLEKGMECDIVVAGQIGGTTPFNRGIAQKVEEELSKIPSDADVVVFLSHHGMFNLDMSIMGLLYDWTEEPYHGYARGAFEGAKGEINTLGIVEGWQGEFDVWQIYAEFVEGMMDPSNEILSVEEAADLAVEQGYDYCINIPYEVGNSGFETLIGLSGCWGIDPPTWKEYQEDGLKKFRTTIEYERMKVVITDGWIEGATDGYLEQIGDAMVSEPTIHVSPSSLSRLNEVITVTLTSISKLVGGILPGMNIMLLMLKLLGTLSPFLGAIGL